MTIDSVRKHRQMPFLKVGMRVFSRLSTHLCKAFWEASLFVALVSACDISKVSLASDICSAVIVALRASCSGISTCPFMLR